MDNNFFITPLGDGLFKLSDGDIFCVYPLKGENYPTDSSEHWHEFVYDKYKIRITWDENTEGIRTNPHWERIYL